jgi:hypothetical protein
MRYFCEGIDKIKVILNPMLVNKDIAKNYFDPHNRLTVHQAGAFTALSIHEEWFNPFFDYQIQIARAIYELVKQKVLNFPDTPFTLYVIYTNPSFFIISTVGVEFYFDFKKENICGYEEMSTAHIDKAKEEGLLYRYHKTNEGGIKTPTETYYSNDVNNSRKSIFTLYNRMKKLLHDNNKDTIENIKEKQNEIRCEIRLTRINSPYLNWDNFKGTYRNIINRFLPYLSVIYTNHICGLFAVKGKDNKQFNKIVVLSKKQQKIRYRGNKLVSGKEVSKQSRNKIEGLDALKELDKTSQNIAKRKKATKLNEMSLKN